MLRAKLERETGPSAPSTKQDVEFIYRLTSTPQSFSLDPPRIGPVSSSRPGSRSGTRRANPDKLLGHDASDRMRPVGSSIGPARADSERWCFQRHRAAA